MDIVFSLNPPLPSKTQIFLKRDQSKDWCGTIKSHAKLKNDNAILSTYTRMESLGLSPDAASLPLVFKACARLNAIEMAKRIHLTVEGTHLARDVRVWTAIVDFYCKAGLLEEAERVFDEMPERDLVSWNALVSGYVGCGCYEEAIGLFREMRDEGVGPNSRTLVTLLLACKGVLDLRLGKAVHGYCLRSGYFDVYPHVGTALIGFYLDFELESSSLVFESMTVRSVVSWNVMIMGYFNAREFMRALELFVRMLEDVVKLDSVTMLIVIQACAALGDFRLGMQIHQMVIKLGYGNDLFVVNALLNMYSDFGYLELSCKLFDTIQVRDVALWNSMIAAYGENGCYEKATNLFLKMRKEVKGDERTISVLLALCSESTDGLRLGKSLHAYACKCGMTVGIPIGNSLLAMYADMNFVGDAVNIFSEMRDIDVVSYNTLISALATNNLWGRAWQRFEQMQEVGIEPNSHTMIAFLSACRDENCLTIGKCFHGVAMKYGIEISPTLNTPLMEMYMFCGDEATAMYLFQTCPDRDLILCNAMIAGYIKSNQAIEAVKLFNCMILEYEIEPNSVTIINILSACTNLANLRQGECLHAHAMRKFSPVGNDLSLANAFITMYSRCGSLQKAENVFKTLRERNIISWNAILTGYSTHGHTDDAILAFRGIISDGFQPNGVTFLSVLSACRHAGLIENGLQLFHSMVHDYKINPVLVHYGCMVDLLGRGGRLDEAREFIDFMPIEPDASIWRALLTACQEYSNTKLAGAVFEKLVDLEPTNAGNYVLLSNIYAAAGLWSEVRKVRTRLKEMGLRKPPGMSWITIRGQIHSFAACDTSHPQSEEVYTTLLSLLDIIRECRYVVDLNLVPDDEED